MTTYDVVNFGSTIDLVKNFLGKRLFANTADYVVQQMRTAIADQKLAIEENSPMFATINGSSIHSGAGTELDPYNAGWLAGFYSGLIEAERNAETGIWFSGSKEEYLVKFLTKQRDIAKAICDADPTEFNSGVLDGYAGWLSGLRGGWINF